MKLLILISALFFWTSACFTSEESSSSEGGEMQASETSEAANTKDFKVQKHKDWGNLKNVRQVARLFFAGQPDEAALQKAKENEIKTVINLRPAAEMKDFDEEAAVKKLEMTYINIPIDEKSKLSAQTLDEIEAAVKANEGNILIHCSSGNRAGAWLAYHLVKAHQMDGKEALKIAKKAGMKKKMKKKVSKVLGIKKDGKKKKTKKKDMEDKA